MGFHWTPLGWSWYVIYLDLDGFGVSRLDVVQASDRQLGRKEDKHREEHVGRTG